MTKEKTHLIIMWIVIFILALFVFTPRGSVEFLLWDDELHITKNPLFKSISWQTFVDIWTSPYEALYIPITYSLWGIVVLLIGLVYGTGWQSQNITWPFLFLNLTIHLFNTFLVYRILKRILIKYSTNSIIFGTLIFLFHPIQVESVVWISAFRDGISVTFSLLTILAYYNRQYYWSYLVVVAAILCKPNAIILPSLIIALDYLRNSTSEEVNTTRPRFYLSILFTIAIPFMLLVKMLQTSRNIWNIPELAYRPIVALDAIGFYLKQVFWPFRYGPDYGRRTSWVISYFPTIEFIIALIFLTSIVWIIRTKWRYREEALIAIVFFLIPLVPVLGIVPFHFQNFSTVADRYAYLSMVGTSLLGAVIYSTLPKARWILCGVLLPLILLSYTHSNYWRRNVEFFEHALVVNPRSDFAESNLGFILANNNRKQEALAKFYRAFELNPAGESASNIGTLLVDLGENEEAFAHYSKVLAMFPLNVEARIGYGVLLARFGRDEEALDHLKIASETEQRDAFGGFNYSIILGKVGRIEESLQQLRNAIKIEPSNEVYKKRLLDIETNSKW